MLLIGVFIFAAINAFLGHGQYDWLVSAVVLAVFVGLTAYHAQKIKNMAVSLIGVSPTIIGLYGALNLYVDFINLFLRLLRLFGRSRD